MAVGRGCVIIPTHAGVSQRLQMEQFLPFTLRNFKTFLFSTFLGVILYVLEDMKGFNSLILSESYLTHCIFS